MTNQFPEETLFGPQRLIEGRTTSGKAAARISAVMAILRERESRGCRFDQRERHHDMLEGAEGLRQLAHSSTYALGSVQVMYQDLVDLIPIRWVPGMQNIGCRLPLSRQADVELWMNEALSRCLRALDQCLAEYSSSMCTESKAKRLQRERGVCAVALWNVIALFKNGCKMADGIVDVNDATDASVKAKAAKAWALLHAVQI